VPDDDQEGAGDGDLGAGSAAAAGDAPVPFAGEGASAGRAHSGLAQVAAQVGCCRGPWRCGCGARAPGRAGGCGAAPRRVNVSTTVPEDNPLDTQDRGVHPLIRFSPHYYNTEDEIDRATELVAALAS
jgi:hypothetical protein